MSFGSSALCFTCHSAALSQPADVGFVSSLSLLLLEQLNSKQNSKVLKACLVQLKLRKYLKIFIEPGVKFRWQLSDGLTMAFLFHFSAISKRSPLLSCKV